MSGLTRTRAFGSMAFGVLLVVGSLGAAPGARAKSVRSNGNPFSAQPAATAAAGYRLLGSDGGVFAHGAHFAGSAASNPAECPPNTADRALPNGTCFSIAATPDGQGYWILDGDRGHVYSFGSAKSYGEPASSFAGIPREFVPRGVSIVPTPDGVGYWVMESGESGLAKVLTFGDA